MIKSFKSLIGDEKKYLTKKITPEKETVFYVFKEIVRENFGKIGSEKLISDYFSKGTLFVRAQNSTWSSELWINRKGILRQLNKKLGGDFVKEIKMK